MSAPARGDDPTAAAHDAVHRTAAPLEDPGCARSVERPASGLSATGGGYLSAAEAAEALGVSHRYIDAMVSTGRLVATTEPGSSHRRVAVADLLEFERTRRVEADAVADIVDELIEAGIAY